VWTASRFTRGDVSAALLRNISLVSASLASLFVYATLRRRFSRAPSAAGTLAVASHPLVLAHAFEGRFYGPWLLFAAVFAWALGLDADLPHSSRRNIALALISCLLVAIHWFGVFSLGLMCAGAVTVFYPRWRVGLRLIAPSAAALIALLALAPMALAQRANASGKLWVENLSVDQVLEMARSFWFAVVPIVAVALLLLNWLSPQRPYALTVRPFAPDLAALLSLALMPVVLMALSVTLQPSMVTRYAIVATLAWAPLVAVAVARLEPRFQDACVAAVALVLVVVAQRAVTEKREYADLVRANTAAFEKAKMMNLPVVFLGLHAIYPVAGPVRSAQSLARDLDLPDSTIAALFPSEPMAPIRKKYRLDRDQARGHERIYGFPILATQAQLDTTSRFILLATDASLPGGYKSPQLFGRALFPRHRAVRIDSTLSLFERIR